MMKKPPQDDFMNFTSQVAANRMNSKVFNRFVEIVYEKSGIKLGPRKVSLVSARIGKRMRTLGIQQYGDYLNHLEQDDSGEEIIHLLDAISTNVTSFFREAQHFSFLSEILREWQNQGQRRFRIWCAASSSGEEPYTIAMTAQETLNNAAGMDFKILATDISTRVLNQAKAGEYLENKVEPVPKMLRNKYFSQVQHGDTRKFAVQEPLKRMITFARLNLSSPPFPMKGPLDVVFCRNVMIYFDDIVRRNLVAEVYRLLRPGGYFIVGHSESLTSIATQFKVVKPSVYYKK